MKELSEIRMADDERNRFILDIRKEIVRSRVIAVIAITGSLLFGIYVSISQRRAFDKALSSMVLIDPKGQIFDNKGLISENKMFEVEGKNHIKNFVLFFYNLNSVNMADNVLKALQLSDKSVLVYKQKKVANGWYNNISNLKLICEVNIQELENNMQVSGDLFRAQFTLTVVNANQSFLITISGKLLRSTRSFPDNPHGLIISDFVETITENTPKN